MTLRMCHLRVHRACYVNGQLGGLSCSTITPLRDHVRRADASQALVKYESSSLLGNMRRGRLRVASIDGFTHPTPRGAHPPPATRHPPPAAAPPCAVLCAVLILQFEPLPCN
jgi:hypothetical protein